MKPTKGVKMVFIGRIAFTLFRGVLWALVCMIYILVAEKVMIKAIKMFKKVNLNLVKTTVLKPVVSLKR